MQKNIEKTVYFRQCLCYNIGEGGERYPRPSNTREEIPRRGGEENDENYSKRQTNDGT